MTKMYAPIKNFARFYVGKTISYSRAIFALLLNCFFLSLESVKALLIWSRVPDTTSRRRIAYNMVAAHANCAIFWTLKNFTRRSMEVSLPLSKIVVLLLKRQYVGMFPVQSVLRERCRNLSLKSVFSKYTVNRNFPTPLELCPFSTTSAIQLFKNIAWLSSRTGKKKSSTLLVSKVLKPD